jgi:hypothetical protein
MWLDQHPMADAAPTRRQALKPGMKVEVRNRFDGAWVPGFEVDAVLDGSYRLLRLSDGAVLPVAIDSDDVRRERRRETWWV